MDDDFDWQPLGEAFWLNASKELGATDRQAKFAAARYRNCSATESARQAGYVAADPGQLRTTAHRLNKSNIVGKLLAFAAAESGGTGYGGTVSRDEARGILSRLARQSDPNIKIRACEQLAKFDEADRQARLVQEEQTPKQIAVALLRETPRHAPGILADAYFETTGQLYGLPFLKELAPILRRDFPASWQRFIDAAKAKPHPDYVDELNAMANGPVLAIEAIIGAAESQKPHTNGHDATEDNLNRE